MTSETPTKEDFSQRINELLGRIAQGKPLAELEATLSDAQKFMDANPEEKPALDYVLREALGDWIVQKDEIAQKAERPGESNVNCIAAYLKDAIAKGTLDQNGSLASFLNAVKFDNPEIRTVIEKYNVTANDVKLGFLKARCFGPVMYNVENMLLAHSIESLFDGQRVDVIENSQKVKILKNGGLVREFDVELPSGGLADLREDGRVRTYIDEHHSTEAWANNYAQRILALDGVISQLEKISEGNRPAETLKAYHVSIVNATYTALKQIIGDERENREKDLLKDDVQEICLALEDLVHSYAKKLGKEEEFVQGVIDLRKQYDGKIEKLTSSIESEQDRLYSSVEIAAQQTEGELKERGKAYVKATLDYAQFSKAYSKVLDENEHTMLRVMEELDSIAAESNMDIEARKAAVYYGINTWGIKDLGYSKLGRLFSK